MHFVFWRLPWKTCTRILPGIMFSDRLPIRTGLGFLVLHVMIRYSMVKKEESISKRFCFWEAAKSWRMKQVICFRWRIASTFNAWWTSPTIYRRVMPGRSPFAPSACASFRSVSDSMRLIVIKSSLISTKERLSKMNPNGYQNVWNGFWTKNGCYLLFYPCPLKCPLIRV